MYVNDKNLTLAQNLKAFKVYALKEMDHALAIEFNKYYDDFKRWADKQPCYVPLKDGSDRI